MALPLPVPVLPEPLVVPPLATLVVPAASVAPADGATVLVPSLPQAANAPQISIKAVGRTKFVKPENAPRPCRTISLRASGVTAHNLANQNMARLSEALFFAVYQIWMTCNRMQAPWRASQT
jgi:hypothetical protein